MAHHLAVAHQKVVLHGYVGPNPLVNAFSVFEKIKENDKKIKK